MSGFDDTMTDIRYTWVQVTANDKAVVLSDPALKRECSLAAGISRSPAIYRWGFYGSGRLAGACIGETENLSVRFRQYLNPGPSQETNKRMNAEFRAAIQRGEEIRLEIVKIAPVRLNRVHICNENLCDPFLRKMMENFLLADFDVVNLRLYNLILNPIERRKRAAGKNNPHLAMLRSMGVGVD